MLPAARWRNIPGSLRPASSAPQPPDPMPHSVDPTVLQEGLARLARLSALRIAVVGDCMIDRFVRGQVDRVSPEAPVPVVHVGSEEERLGGAANVAANAVALGAKVDLFALAGEDPAAERLSALLEKAGIVQTGVVRSAMRCTTMKTRILAGGQQIVRIDRESTGALGERDRHSLLDRLEAAGPFAAVVVSDYGKGVIDEELMQRLRQWHDDGVVVVVDPKQGNFELYRGVSAITPNEKEAAGACHAKIEGAEDAARVGAELMHRLGTDMILLTRGENGICLLHGDEAPRHIPTEARQVFDVTGAGDTVIAGFTALLAAGASPELAARMANAAAGVAVATLGTATIDAATLAQAWRRRMGDSS